MLIIKIMMLGFTNVFAWILFFTFPFFSLAQTIYEAEAALVSGGASVQGSYVGNLHISGSSVTFSVTASATGYYRTTFYSATPGYGKLNLYVNDTLKALHFFGTSKDWTTYLPSTNFVFLKQGINKIALKNDEWFNSGVNLDKMVVQTATSSELPKPICIPFASPVVHILASEVSYSQINQLLPRTAKRASAFVNSLGFNASITTTNNLYFDNVIKPRLLEIGVKNLRVSGSNTQLHIDRMKDLNITGGILFNPIFDPRAFQVPEIPAILRMCKNLVSTIEGPNELDLSPIPAWNELACKYMKELNDTLHKASDLKDIPVLGPSFTSPNAWESVGDMRQWTDFAAMHDYTRDPGTPGWGNNGYGSLKYNIDIAQNYKPGVIPYSTETGYAHHAQGFPDDIKSKYLARIYLEHFNWGVPKTYLYRFENEFPGSDNESNFGIINPDGSPRPAFYVIKNMISTLMDDTATFNPKPLTFGLSGEYNNVHYTLLQKRDEAYYLVMWIEKSSWNIDNLTRIPVVPQTITLNLNKPAQQIERVDIFNNTTWKMIGAQTKQVTQILSDSVSIFKITFPKVATLLSDEITEKLKMKVFYDHTSETLHILNAEGYSAEVYELSGKSIGNVELRNGNGSLKCQLNGVFIVKSGRQVSKIVSSF